MGSCDPLLTSTNLPCTERWHQTADSEAEQHGSVKKTLQFGYRDGGELGGAVIEPLDSPFWTLHPLTGGDTVPVSN